MKNNNHHLNHEPDPLPRRLREAAPSASIDGEHRRALKKRLHSTLKRRYRKRILTIGLASVVVVTGLVFVLDNRQRFPSGEMVNSLTGTSGDTNSEPYLSEVEGWTVEGETVFEVTYVRPDSEQAIQSRIPHPPASEISPALELLLKTQASAIRAAVAKGVAVPLADVDLDIAGITIRFRRWQATSVDWGSVVYWQGVPVTENQSKS